MRRNRRPGRLRNPVDDEAHTAFVPLSPTGALCVATVNGGAVDVLFDVVGYFGGDAKLHFSPATSKGLVGGDSGYDPSTPPTAIKPTAYDVKGVPSDATGVVLNLTARGRRLAGYISVYPCDEPVPESSNLNVTPDTWAASNILFGEVTPGASDIYGTHQVEYMWSYSTETGKATRLFPMRQGLSGASAAATLIYGTPVVGADCNIYVSQHADLWSGVGQLASTKLVRIRPQSGAEQSVADLGAGDRTYVAVADKGGIVASAGPDLVRFDVASGTVEALARSSRSAVISRDLTRVYWIVLESSGVTSTLIEYDRTTGRARELTSGLYSNQAPVLSPDGKTALFGGKHVERGDSKFSAFAATQQSAPHLSSILRSKQRWTHRDAVGPRGAPPRVRRTRRRR